MACLCVVVEVARVALAGPTPVVCRQPRFRSGGAAGRARSQPQVRNGGKIRGGGWEDREQGGKHLGPNRRKTLGLRPSVGQLAVLSHAVPGRWAEGARDSRHHTPLTMTVSPCPAQRPGTAWDQRVMTSCRTPGLVPPPCPECMPPVGFEVLPRALHGPVHDPAAPAPLVFPTGR